MSFSIHAIETFFGNSCWQRHVDSMTLIGGWADSRFNSVTSIEPIFEPDTTMAKTFDSEALAYVLVGISVLCIVSQIGITIFIDCGLWNRLRTEGKNTLILPLNDDDEMTDEQKVPSLTNCVK